MQNQLATHRGHARARRGISTFWLILVLPLFVILLCFVADIGNVWLARVELENAMEAAALAAVKEWGDQGGGSTLQPRQVGRTYALVNDVNGAGVPIDLNYDPTRLPNENLSCEGNLVFGAVVTTDRPWVVDTRVAPSCGIGEVLVDASSQGNLAANNAWGISFRASSQDSINQNLRIRRVIIDVDPDDIDVAHFDGTATLSDNSQPAVHDNASNEQPDNYGWNQTPPTQDPQAGPPSDQISFSFDKPSPSTSKPRQLIMDFQSAGSDDGFSPGDRFRFGANVLIQNNGGRFGEASGDEVGQIATRVTIFFQLGGQDLDPVVATLVDSGGRRNNCLDNEFFTDPLGIQHLIVHEDRIVDLPCPPNASSQPSNNGQSRTIVGGSGEREFAVRAQKTIQIPSLSCRFCGNLFGPYTITAKATAMYECDTRRPRLIRVRPENFICE